MVQSYQQVAAANATELTQSKGHFTPKNLVHLWQKSFCFQEKSIKNPYKSSCFEKSRPLFLMSEVPLDPIIEFSAVKFVPI